MTPLAIGHIEARLDSHDEALDQIRGQQKEDRDDVRSIRNWIIATLAAVCGGTILVLITILTKKVGLS